jgi:hypothetical protein
MFRTIASKVSRDKDCSDRQFTLDIYNRVLEGALYDHLPWGFHNEKQSTGEYIPLRDRRPSVRYNLCRLVVDDSVSLLFSEGHFPTADCKDVKIKQSVADLIKETGLNEIMLEAATRGSVGSVAIHLRALKQGDGSHRIFFKSYRTTFLTPTFDPKAPDTLLKITETYKVKGSSLRQAGYTIEDKHLNSEFWFKREWDADNENWFNPWLVIADDANADLSRADVVDSGRSVNHGLGFVPWVWVKNLPGELKLVSVDGPNAMAGAGPQMQFSDHDGACTFAAAIDSMIEIDYQLSQSGRGLKYSMDPLLMLKEPAGAEDEFIKSPANALITGKDGDAKLLEIEGSAFQVVLEYVRALREMALEQIHGNRANSDKISAAQSGRAMELLNQALIWLADRLRVSYGEGALLSLLKMAIAAHRKYPLTVLGNKWPEMPADALISLTWPRWYQPTARDRQENATTLKSHKEAGHISRETAVKAIAPDYDIEDVAGELARIEADQKAEIALIPQGTNPGSVKTTI